MLNALSSVSRSSSASTPEARRTSPAGADGAIVSAQQRTDGKRTTTDAEKKTSAVGGKRELTDDERQQVEELKRIDRHVRQHEAAHQAAAGGLARGKSFTYKQGPDGNQYAVAGEVQIDTSAVPGNPQATIAKMQRIRAAASAPADPSSQDRAVTAQAARVEAEARAELLKPEEKEQQPTVSTVGSPPDDKTEEESGPGIPQHTSTHSATFSPFASSSEHRGAFINAYA